MDTKIVFRAKASSGLARLSYKSKKEDYVSNKKVDPSNLEKRKSKLLYEDQNQCLETATFFSYDPKTEVFGLGGKITKKAHQVHYADSPTGKETAKHKNLSDKRSYLQKKKTLLAEVDKVLICGRMRKINKSMIRKLCLCQLIRFQGCHSACL